MGFWLDLAGFSARALILALAVGGVLVAALLAARRGRGEPAPTVEIVDLNERYEDMERRAAEAALDRKAFRLWTKARKAARKAGRAAELDGARDDGAPDAGPGSEILQGRPRLLTLDVSGDPRGGGLETLGLRVSAALALARPGVDEIVARIESPGGAVTAYGAAASELLRVRAAGVRLVACVDQVAASGGYMLAVCADRIVAAPFAVVGSIGVVAPAPNLNRLLKRFDVDYEELTAGAYKRPLSLLGPNTEEGKRHFVEKLEATHDAFKAFVKRQRPAMDMERVANGDFWYGEEALALGLIDGLSTAEDYLYARRNEARLLAITAKRREKGLRAVLKRLGA